MKKILSIITVVILMGSCQDKKEEPVVIVNEAPKDVKYASYASKPVDSNYTKDDIEFLKEMGLGSSYTVRTNASVLMKGVADKYMNKFGVKFINDEAVALFLEEKNMIIGSLSAFNGTIPKKEIEMFKTNISRIRSIDSSFNEYYFIRTELECGGFFLQKISEDEIKSGKGIISESPNLNAGQEAGATLYPNREKYYKEKYNVRSGCDIIIGKYTPYMQIVAPKELFNMEGKTLVGRQLVEAKDPAILLRVPEGWLVLAAWD